MPQKYMIHCSISYAIFPKIQISTKLFASGSKTLNLKPARPARPVRIEGSRMRINAIARLLTVSLCRYIYSDEIISQIFIFSLLNQNFTIYLHMNSLSRHVKSKLSGGWRNVHEAGHGGGCWVDRLTDWKCTRVSAKLDAIFGAWRGVIAMMAMEMHYVW